MSHAEEDTCMSYEAAFLAMPVCKKERVKGKGEWEGKERRRRIHACHMRRIHACCSLPVLDLLIAAGLEHQLEHVAVCEQHISNTLATH
jgi:hypothetical protein